MRDCYIVGSGVCLPNEPVVNDNIEQILGQTGEHPSRIKRLILRQNGIKSRHYAINRKTGKQSHTNAQITAKAVKQLIDQHQIHPLPCLACGTSLPDQIMPNHALMVQGELGIPACEAIATSGICLSGLAAFKYAHMAVASGQHEEAIATGSELVSPHLLADRFRKSSIKDVERLEKAPELAFEQDFLRWMLSDGAGALLLRSKPNENTLNLRVDWVEILSFAGEMPVCMYAGATVSDDGEFTGWAAMPKEDRDQKSAMSIKQNVKLLNRHIVEYMIDRPFPIVMDKYGLRAETIDYFLPHYSSDYFREKVVKALERVGCSIPQSRWFTNLAEKGNTGGASIFIMLDELFHNGCLKPGQRILCWVPESGRFSCGFMHLTVA